MKKKRRRRTRRKMKPRIKDNLLFFFFFIQRKHAKKCSREPASQPALCFWKQAEGALQSRH